MLFPPVFAAVSSRLFLCPNRLFSLFLQAGKTFSAPCFTGMLAPFQRHAHLYATRCAPLFAFLHEKRPVPPTGTDLLLYQIIFHTSVRETYRLPFPAFYNTKIINNIHSHFYIPCSCPTVFTEQIYNIFPLLSSPILEINIQTYANHLVCTRKRIASSQHAGVHQCLCRLGAFG